MFNFDNLNGFLSSALVATAGGVVGAILALVVNIRTGKNQEDRIELRQLYTIIRQSLVGMLEDLKKNDPVTRRNNESRAHGVEPSLLTDDDSGTANEKFLIVPKGILADLRAMESKVLDFGDELYQEAFEIWKICVSKLEGMKTDEIYRINDGNYVIVGRETRGGPRTIATLSIMRMLLDENIYKRTVAVFDKHPESAFSANVLYDYHIEVNPGAIKEMSLLDFIELVQKTTRQSPKINEFKNKKDLLIADLQATIQRLESRIQDPHPLWETLSAAIKDLFSKS